MTKDELIISQAKIRDNQRERLDIIHDLCHQFQRNEYREQLGGDLQKNAQSNMIKNIHNIIHDFMWDFDRAVLIHERMAILENRNPAEVTKSLLPVRTIENNEKTKIGFLVLNKI